MLEPRRRVDKALYAVIMETYIGGVSTLKIDALVVTWTPKTDPALMRASLSARLGQEKPHETQTPQP